MERDEDGKGDEVDFDELVGANIRAYRTAIGMSQLELAEALGRATGERIHQQTILKIEKGTRPLKYSEAISLAKVLNVPDSMLMAGREKGDINAVLLQMHREFRRQHDALADFAAQIAPRLVDYALLLAAIEHNPLLDEDGKPVQYGSLKTHAEAWVHANWGKSLNREIMAALRKQDYLTDLREEFEGDSYLEILERVRAAELGTKHPSVSRLPVFEFLKWRPPVDDDADA